MLKKNSLNFHNPHVYMMILIFFFLLTKITLKSVLVILVSSLGFIVEKYFKNTNKIT